MSNDTQIVTLTEFLLARIAEDEAAAEDHHGERSWMAEFRRPVLPSEVGRWDVVSVARDYDAPDYPADRVAQAYINFPMGRERATADHIARHDPARVLAECEAKRALVGFRGAIGIPEDGSVEPGTGMAYLNGAHAAVANERERILRLLALPYADHPDYDEAWRP